MGDSQILSSAMWPASRYCHVCESVTPHDHDTTISGRGLLGPTNLGQRFTCRKCGEVTT